MEDDTNLRKSREKRRVDSDEEEEGGSEKRARLEVSEGSEMALITFDVIFNESLSVFRAYNKRKPGQFTVTLYCQPGHQFEENKMSPFNAKILNESLSVSTARFRSHFNFHGPFRRNSEFFVDVDLGFSVPVSRVELKDGLNFGRVSTISAGLNCLGNHDHWSHGHWQPAWSRYIPAPQRLDEFVIPGKIVSSAIVVPEKAQATPVSTFRFEMNFYSKGTFFTDFTSYVHLNPEVSKSRNFALPLPELPPPQNFGLSTQSFESIPDRALIQIINSLRGIHRFQAHLSLSGTCRRFREMLREPSLFSTLDFKVVPPAYFTPALFNFVAERATEVRHLRLAWMPHLPDGVNFGKFLRRLAPGTMISFNGEACPFVDDKILRVLSETQPNLEHLDVTRCHAISPDGFRYILPFRKLRRLSLQHTNIAERPLCQLIENFTSLEVLNISLLSSFDHKFARSPDPPVSQVFQVLIGAQTMPNLVALKINQMQCDTASFVTLLRQCPKMEELNCVQPEFFDCKLDSSIFSEIANSCPLMRRLSISELAHRNCLKEEDMQKLVEGLPNLEYLFVVPTNLSAEFVERVFENAQQLICLVIAGRKMSPAEVEQVRQKFPNRRLIYTDVRPTWQANESFGQSEPSSPSETSSSSSSSTSSGEDEEDNSTGFGESEYSSEESRTELERFQQETNAQITPLVSSVKDLTRSVEDVRSLLEHLLNKRMFYKRKVVIADIRFAMATAVYHERYDVLEMLLERCPVKDLPDVLTGDFPLLNFAIKLKSVDAIRVLLEKGAPPNPEHEMSALGTVVITLMDIFDGDEAYTPSVCAFFCEVLKLLFKFNADPLFFNPEERGTNVLHYTAYLAGNAPEIADLLVEKTPGSAYFSQELFSSDVYEGPTPLASVFDMIDISDELSVARNIFQHALLPFLRYGAPYKPDNCFSSSTMSEIVAIDHFFSQRIWGRPHVLAQILIESRRNSRLDVAALTKASAPRPRPAVRELVLGNNNDESDEEMSDGEDQGGLDGVSDEETGDLIGPFSEFIRTKFPRPLQAQCRTVILSKLPVGPSRLEAVADLDLPKSLTSFLKFDEFNLLPVEDNKTD